jgi:hypothetical protein
VERRAQPRHLIWFPVTIESSPGTPGELWSVCRDVSTGGILVNAAGLLEAGAKVAVTFRVHPDDAEERRLEGRIVRIMPNTDDPLGPWPHRLAIEFDEPVPELEAILSARAPRTG